MANKISTTPRQVNAAKKSAKQPKQPSAQDDSTFCDFEWLQLKPKGIVFEGGHFVFILENGEKKAVLPLRYPVQTADLLGVVNMQSLWRKSLGYMFQGLFADWDVQFKRCVFIKLENGKHSVRLHYIKEQKETFIEASLDLVLGLCLEGQLPFYATREYIAKSQVLEQENEIFLQKQKWTDGTQRYLM